MTSFQKIMMLIGLAGLSVALLVPLVLSVTPQLRRVRKLFFFAVAGLALYAGAKRSGTITYPDIGGVNYLINLGSYVTNDYVHIDFTTVAIPSSANLCIARKQLDVAEAQWVEHLETTIADFNPPQNLQFANATNYDWMVFSDWTPGPAVETNGVWNCYWGLDQQLHEKLIPLRTCITVNGDVIATPKSKKDALPYDAEVEYLESTGTQGFPISSSVNNNMVFELGISIHGQLKSVAILGVAGTSFCYWPSGNRYFGFDGASYTSFNYNADERYNISINLKTGEYIFNGSTGTVRANFTNIQSELWIFKKYGEEVSLRRRFYFFRMHDGNLVRDFIPVRFTNENGETEGAMYDKISRQLYRNQGTGKFVIGPDKQ